MESVYFCAAATAGLTDGTWGAIRERVQPGAEHDVLTHPAANGGGEAVLGVTAPAGDLCSGPITGSSIIGQVVLVWWHDGHPDLHWF
jgi:hypothetical protein